MIPDGKEFRRLRKSAGLTQKQLAEEAGFSQALIARIERGSVNPTLRTLQKIHSALSPQKKSGMLLLMSNPVIYAMPHMKLRDAVALMQENDISQMPVMDRGKQVGSIVDSELVKIRGRLDSLLVREAMSRPFPEVGPDTGRDELAEMLCRSPAVLVVRDGAVAGIITRADFLRAYFS